VVPEVGSEASYPTTNAYQVLSSSSVASAAVSRFPLYRGTANTLDDFNYSIEGIVSASNHGVGQFQRHSLAMYGHPYLGYNNQAFSRPQQASW